MMIPIAWRLLTGTDKRLLVKFMLNFGWKGFVAVEKFKKRAAKGEIYPAFVFISVTNACNLRCQGCWVTQTQPPVELPPSTLDRIVSETKKKGGFFFGILGGEPLLYDPLFDVLGRHPDCYFQVFSNGTLITPEVAQRMRKLGNITPLISIEGLEKVSDERRGGESVYARALRGLECCRANRLITGVATSVCRSNFGEVVSADFARDMVRRGVHYLWYYFYRPAGNNPCRELALSREQVLELRRFIVDIRTKVPILIVDTYWDHAGKALCPAAIGISHHINPWGDIEPCPPVQFACEGVGDGSGLDETFARSHFLASFRRTAAECSRGCILLEHPDVLKQLVDREGARDTSRRGCGTAELGAATPLPSHHVPGSEIPEKSWMYRFAKKHWFFGFGAYG